MKRLLYLALFFSFAFPVGLYPQFDKALDARLNPNQPIYEGQLIYTIRKDGSCYIDGSLYYYVESTEYFYKELYKDNIVVISKYTYADEFITPDKRYKTVELFLPLDDKQSALLSAEDGQVLKLQVFNPLSILAEKM